jgi:hypothetical protein
MIAFVHRHMALSLTPGAGFYGVPALVVVAFSAHRNQARSTARWEGWSGPSKTTDFASLPTLWASATRW